MNIVKKILNVNFTRIVVNGKLEKENNVMSEQWPKCWGANTEIFRNDSVSVNFLNLVKGGVCSWHLHQHKYNTFYLISGKVVIRTELGETVLNPGNSILVSAPMKHQFEALEDSGLIEIMWVSYDQRDIVRLVEGFRRKEEVKK